MCRQRAMPLSTHFIITLPLLVLVASVALIIWGWRGKRHDAHPICRRCGFDLFGLPPGRRVCSECGNDLNRRRATRCGNRRVRVGTPAVLHYDRELRINGDEVPIDRTQPQSEVDGPRLVLDPGKITGGLRDPPPLRSLP